MPILPVVTASELARRAKDLLEDAAELTSGSDPNYIRDAQPDSVFEAIPLAAARQGCRRYADNPDGYSGARQARVERACRPYLDDIGYGDGPVVKVPFRGGQCYGVQYRVTLAFTNPPIGDQTNQQIVSARVVGTFRGDRQPNQLTPVGIETQQTPGGPINRLNIASLSDENVGSFRIQSIVVEGGGVDECGNPPTEITDPVPPVSPGPRREPFVRVPDIDIDIDVEVNPDLTIDVDFGTGPITIDPFGDDPDGGGDGGGGAPPGDVGDPGTPEDTGPGGDADGEAPEGSVLTGLRVDFVEPPIGGKEYAPGVYRGVCYIYMGTAEGLDHDPAGAMLRSGQFIFAEQPNLTRWFVSANLGFSLRVTPYYRPVEAEE